MAYQIFYELNQTKTIMEPLGNYVETAKKWYQSQTILATIFGALSAILGSLGYDVGDIIGVSFTEAEAIAGQVDAVWVSIQALIAALIAGWGRIKAELPIRV